MSVAHLEIYMGDLRDQMAEIHYDVCPHKDEYPVITKCLIEIAGTEVDVRNELTAGARLGIKEQLHEIENELKESGRAKVGDRDVS